VNAEKYNKDAGDESQSPVSMIRRWTRLLIAVLALSALVHFAPAVERLPGVGKQVTALRESGIDVGAWYYDDVEQYFEAEEFMLRKRADNPRVFKVSSSLDRE